MHDSRLPVRLQAVKLACRVVTDQNTAQDLVAANAVLSLLLMLQEGRSEELVDTATGSALRDASVRGLRFLHRFRPRRGGDNDEVEIIPVGSKEDISDTAESEMLEECLRVAGIPMHDGHHDTSSLEEQAEYQKLSRPCFHIAYHTPELLAPATKIVHQGMRGRPAVTVIERADSQRRLMYLGTFYLEGFCESEASRGMLGQELLFWYAKAVIGALAGAGAIEGTGRRILILGLGAGVLPAFIQAHFPDVECDVCEIHRGVLEAARKGFGLIDDNVAETRRSPVKGEYHLNESNGGSAPSDALGYLNIHIADCRQLVKSLIRNGNQYDAVVSDVYGDGGMPRCLCDVEYLVNMRKLVEARKGTVIVNCGNEMDDFDVLRNNFRWTFRDHTVELGHPDEENHILVGSCSLSITSDPTGDSCSKCQALLPTDLEWKERVTTLVPSHLFSLFLVHKVGDPAVFFVTWIDNNGICAADSLSQNAPKLQYATKSGEEESATTIISKK